jgi:hypothetical protein
MVSTVYASCIRVADMRFVCPMSADLSNFDGPRRFIAWSPTTTSVTYLMDSGFLRKKNFKNTWYLLMTGNVSGFLYYGREDGGGLHQTT